MCYNENYVHQCVHSSAHIFNYQIDLVCLLNKFARYKLWCDRFYWCQYCNRNGNRNLYWYQCTYVPNTWHIPHRMHKYFVSKSKKKSVFFYLSSFAHIDAYAIENLIKLHASINRAFYHCYDTCQTHTTCCFPAFLPYVNVLTKMHELFLRLCFDFQRSNTHINTLSDYFHAHITEKFNKNKTKINRTILLCNNTIIIIKNREELKTSRCQWLFYANSNDEIINNDDSNNKTKIKRARIKCRYILSAIERYELMLFCYCECHY